MTIEQIINRREQLDKDLQLALSTMERSDKIKLIKEAIIENQKHCPHFDSNYNWAIVNEICPYCGFHLTNGRDY